MFNQSSISRYPIFRSQTGSTSHLTPTHLRIDEHNSTFLDLSFLYFDDNGDSVIWTPSSTQLPV